MNVLSLRMGPPAATPNWLRLKGGIVGPSKKFRASRPLLRRNSYAEPWNEFVPEREIPLTTPPELLPYSAEKLLVSTENSWIASTPKVPPITLPGGPLEWSL